MPLRCANGNRDRRYSRSSDAGQTVRHSFTHYDLDIMPIAVRLQCISGTVADTDDQMWYEFGSPQQVGIAAPVTGLLDKLKTDELLTNVTDS